MQRTKSLLLVFILENLLGRLHRRRSAENIFIISLNISGQRTYRHSFSGSPVVTSHSAGLSDAWPFSSSRSFCWDRPRISGKEWEIYESLTEIKSTKYGSIMFNSSKQSLAGFRSWSPCSQPRWPAFSSLSVRISTRKYACPSTPFPLSTGTG